MHASIALYGATTTSYAAPCPFKTGPIKLKLLAAFIFLGLLAPSHLLAVSPTPLWQDVIDGNNLIIMRHALAPGTGDPDNFDLQNCSTQRNLSEQGREQAKAIGSNFKEAGIKDAQIYTSQWCRCVDTATEMQIGTIEELPFLNSFYGRPDIKPEQMKNLRAWLQSLDTDSPTILVTHQVVITALTGVYPASGEAVIFTASEDGEISVIDTIAPD